MSALAGAVAAITASHRLEQTRKKHAWQQLFLDSLAVLHRPTQEADLSHEFFDTTPGKSYAATFLAPIFLGERQKERRKASPKPQEQPKPKPKPMPKPAGRESPPAALASMNNAERKALASMSEDERKAIASSMREDERHMAFASMSEDERKALASSMREDERHMAFEDASAALGAAPAEPEAAPIVITKKKKKKKHFHGQTLFAQGPARQWDPRTWRPLALTPRGYDTTGYDIGQAAHHLIDATPRRDLDPSYMRVVGEDVYVKSNTAGFEVPHGDL